MATVKFGSAGVSAKEIDLSGPVAVQPTGIPAGVIGTATKGPAFVPVTVGLDKDFYAKFGTTDGKKFGPLAVVEWLKNAQAVTYLRVLGVGDGTKRTTSGNTAGSVTRAGFVVGEQQPNADTGLLGDNVYANAGGPLGRTYFLGAFMSESAGSTVFSDAGLQGVNSVTPGVTSSLPIVRGVVLAASGVILRLSSSMSGANAAPASTLVATNDNSSGGVLGTAILSSGGVALQNFTFLLNGHKGTDPKYPNVYTASFDTTAPNYFANVLNRDPQKLNEAGHVLYAYWDIHSALAVVTGTGLVTPTMGASSPTVGSKLAGAEAAAFLVTGSMARNTGDTFAPNYENFEDRFRHAVTPWIVSQKFGGAPTNLFRLHMLDDGAGTATKVKVSIENITPSSDTLDVYGTFDVILRDFADTDLSPRALEQFRGCTLNPSSDRYIGKLIGDLNVFFDFDRVESAQKVVVDGNYANKSNYVRVEIDSGVVEGTTPASALPIGFRGPQHLVTSGTLPLTAATTGELAVTTALKRSVQPPVPYRLNVADGAGNKVLVNSSLYWGVQFEQVNSLTTPNGTSVRNLSVESFTKYFPDFMTSIQDMVAGPESVGVADTAALGIVDADRFNKNFFSLENIRITTASNGIADPQKWVDADYVRNGNVGTDDSAKTRAVAIADFTTANRRFLKFTTFLQGGFDGTNMMNADEADLSNAAVKADMEDTSRGLTSGPTVKAYLKALEVMKNKTDADVQLLVIPGIRHSIVTDNAIAAVEDRFDALYLMDIEEYDTLNASVTSNLQQTSVQNTVTAFSNRAINSSFAAAYFPDVVIQDPNTKTNVVCPPSVAVLGAFALNDAIAHPWFAPAGFARGSLVSVLETKVRLSKDNMDALYNANINPLTAFPGTTPPGTQAQGGCIIWGQRTLQSFASALDRVNVRRLLINIRRQVKEISNSIIFEPSRESTLQKFASGIEPRLAKIQKQFGVTRYLVKIDTTTTTQADIENLTLRGKIYVQPTRSIELVSLDFVVTNAGKDVG